MAAPILNVSPGSESDRVERRSDDPLLKVEAILIEEIQTLEEAWDQANDKGYGNPVAIGEALRTKRAELHSLKLIKAMRG